MNGRNHGFTLIEMLIVIAIFGIVLAGTTQMVASMLANQSQQSKIAESNIEGIIGLEMLRQDLGKSGYGLPWNGLVNYNEVAAGVPAPASSLNDAPTGAPRGIVSSDGGGWNGTDYLVIKATNVANTASNGACTKWNFIAPDNSYTPWSPATTNDNFVSTDRVIILKPGSPSNESTAKVLITSGSFYARWDSTAGLASTMTTTGIAYGIDSNDLRMPFNRADYYVKQPSSGLPQRCAPGTGILYKGIVNQSNGNLTELPLLDCVADMQVVFRLIDPVTGNVTVASNVIGMSAQNIRDEVKEVRVYILTHEGQRDINFTYPTNSIYVGGDALIGSSNGRSFSLTGIQNWQNYRWKVYTIVTQLENLL